jgi:hypothetical protein
MSREASRNLNNSTAELFNSRSHRKFHIYMIRPFTTPPTVSLIQSMQLALDDLLIPLHRDPSVLDLVNSRLLYGSISTSFI